MKILTLIRQVLDAESSVRLTASRVDLSASKLVVDTMDEYGVEQALRFKDADPATEVIVLAIGPPRTEEALRSALAMGADRAILIETDPAADPLDPITLSSIAAQVAQSEQPDLILLGGQQADWDSSALGPALAARLDWAQLTWTTSLTLAGRTLTATHDVDAGSESVTLTIPAVLTTQQGLNDPRYPTLPNIMKAKKKELRRQPITDFALTPKLKLVSAAIQPRERRHTVLDGKDPLAAATQLVQLLRTEARVL